MDDIALLKELVPLLQAGGNVALLALAFLCFKVWQSLQAIDRRVMRLEIHWGIETGGDTPATITRPVSRVIPPVAALALLLPLLGGCSALTGEVLGASISIGGFTVGVSGSLPGAKPPPQD